MAQPILRAKFQVRYITRRDANWGVVPKDIPAKSEIVYLSPVYGEGEANKEWSEATPAGTLEMTINNAAAHGKLVEGKDYYIDFTPAD